MHVLQPAYDYTSTITCACMREKYTLLNTSCGGAIDFRGCGEQEQNKGRFN